MKSFPNARKNIATSLSLLGFVIIFIAASLVIAQDNPPITPVLGDVPTTPPILIPNLEEPDAALVETKSTLTGMIYLPIVSRPDSCDLNSQEQEIADFAIQHPNQGRQFMICDPILAQVARERALDMGTRNYFDHTNPDGYGPNYLVKQAGYILPSWYGSSDAANNIESIAGGYTTAAAAWAGWLNSSGHRVHVLAEQSFWADQTNYGIGYAYVPNSTYRHYWVFISAPPEE